MVNNDIKYTGKYEPTIQSKGKICEYTNISSSSLTFHVYFQQLLINQLKTETWVIIYSGIITRIMYDKQYNKR